MDYVRYLVSFFRLQTICILFYVFEILNDVE